MSEPTHRDSADMLVPLNRRNYILGIINGVAVAVGSCMADPLTFLPLLLVRLTEAAWPVGLLQAIVIVGPAIPAVFLTPIVDTTPQKLSIFRKCSIIRFSSVMGMAAWVLLGHRLSALMVTVLLLVFFAIHIIASGMSNTAFVDIVAKSTPTTKRGTFWMWRQTIGALLTMTVAIPLISYLTGERWSERFPVNYGILMLIAALVQGFSWFVYWFVHEPPGRVARHRLTPRQQIARGVRFWRQDKRYRRMIRVLFLLSSTGAIGPFFTAFAVQVWHFPDTVAATFVTVQMLALMGGAVLQGWVSNRYGSRRVLILAASSALFAAVVATGAALLAPVGGIEILGYPLSYRLMLLCLCFVGNGVFTAQLWVGYVGYIMDIAPARKRPSYVGLASLFVLPAGLVSLGYGWLAGSVGFEVVFGIAAALAAAALVLSLRMSEPRDELTAEQLEAFS